MTAKLKKMDMPKYSRNGNVCFRRLYFELEDGNFAVTDLVPSFRNFKWWEPVIKSGIGTVIGGVFLKDGYKDKINADSQVFIVQEPLVKNHTSLPIYPVPQSNPHAPRVYEIPSFTTAGKSYEVTSEYGFMRCSCPDFKYMHRKCKHIKVIEKAKVESMKQKQVTLF